MQDQAMKETDRAETVSGEPKIPEPEAVTHFRNRFPRDCTPMSYGPVNFELAWAVLDHIDFLRARVEELERERDEAQMVCGETYQVLGALASYAGVFCTDDVERALDNLAQHKRVHSDLLPWPKSAAPFLALEKGEKR